MGLTNGDGYNLLDEPWIPILYADGRFARIGIGTALREAGKIRQIAAGNPMDRVSLLRFLLAVLLWCRDGVSEEDRVNLAGMTEGVPDQWLEKLDEYKAKFNLLGEGERFFQERHVRHAAA